MKILCISDAWTPQVNGVVRTYQQLGRELERRGHHFTVIGPADFPLTVPAPTYPEIRLTLFASLFLPAKIRDVSPDAIHIATEGPLGRAARRYCLKYRLPFSTCYHTRFPEYLAARIKSPRLADWVAARAGRSLQNFHAASSAVMVATRRLEQDLLLQGYAPRFHLFARGVDTRLFRCGPKTLFPHLKSPVVLYVGRVSLEKNIEAFLDTPWPGSKVVVGQGPALASLRKKYPDVTFTGLQEGEALAAHYRSADLFVFPSRTETFGVVLLEALASGLPVAAYPVSGPLDLIDSPVFGTLDADLSAAMAAALRSPALPSERAAQVAALYTWDAAAAQFLNGLQPLKP